MLNAFKVYNVSRIDSETVRVKVRMDSKAWLKAKHTGTLGQLYGIDISNAVSKQYGVIAYRPSVSDQDNARGGIKWLELTYQDSQWAPIDNVIPVNFMARYRPILNDNNRDNLIKVDFVNKRRIAA